ncbi:MAG: hypothetical protein IT425_13445 [Pirellulales bacterium]|nr:hypothetical protein [Pirellulales bacterium]
MRSSSFNRRNRLFLRCLLMGICATPVIGLNADLSAGVPLHNGLLTTWAFDEGSGSSLVDLGPAGVTIDSPTLRNSPSWITGKFGSALRFNGTNQDALVPNSTDMNIGTNAVTLAAWVKLDQFPSGMTGSYSGIFDSDQDNYILYLDKANNELRFKVTTSTGAAERPGVPSSLLDTTNWNHVMGVYDGSLGEARMYFNGQLVDTHSSPSLINNVRTGQIAGIGSQPAAASPNTPANLFKGNIDDMGIWNRALGLAEAQYLYNTGVGNAILAANPSIDPILPPVVHNPSIAVEAHRGNPVLAPENTYASITASAGYADFVEFDVQVTADNKLIIMHDGSVDRTTNGTGSISGLNYTGYIDSLDAGSWFSPTFAGEPVPLLTPFVESIRSYGMRPLLERKSGSAAAIVNELNAIGALSETVIICFDWNFLSSVRALAPNTKLGALGSGTINSTVINNVLNAGGNFLDWSDSSSITQSVVDMVHAAGLELHVWTVDNLARMQQLIDLGVDGITTNAPHTLRSIVPLPGDFNYDNTVDTADYSVWRKSMGDSENYLQWRSNFGRTAPTSGAASGGGITSASVPEPCSFLLAAFIVCLIGHRRFTSLHARPVATSQ